MFGLNQNEELDALMDVMDVMELMAKSCRGIADHRIREISSDNLTDTGHRNALACGFVTKSNEVVESFNAKLINGLAA